MASSSSADHELIQLVRSGDLAALGELYQRHREAATRVARAVTGDRMLADDLVSEAFERIHGAIARGAGPEESFRAYLYTVIRRLAAEHGGAKSRLEDTDDFTPYEAITASDDGTERSTEAAIVGSAFATLQPRHQAVLWYLEVEGMSTAEAATFFGLSANATAALANRARSALKDAYLQAHVSGTGVAASCEPVRGKLGPYRAGSLSARDTGKVEAHLETCEECPVVLAELADVGHGLRAIIAPLVLGGTAAAGLVLGAPASSASAAAVLGPRGIRIPGRVLAVAAAGVAVLAIAAGALGLAVAASSSSAEADDDAVTVASAEQSDAPSPAAGATPAPTTSPTPTPAPTVPAPPPVKTPAPGAGTAPAPAPSAPSPSAPPTLVAAAVPAVSFLDAGDLVLGRVGVVALEIASTGAEATDASARLVLPEGVTVDTSRPISTSGGIPWSCTAAAAVVDCAAAVVPAQSSSAVYVPVAVSAGAPLGGRASATIAVAGAAPVASASTAGVVADGIGTRFLADGGLDLVHAGATLLSCDPALAGCLEARRREGGALTNNAWAMIPVDGAGLGAPSSSSVLTIPAGATVRFAGLYWGAGIPSGASDAQLGSAMLAAPGQATAAPIAASLVERSGGAYLAFADVTATVAAAGGGTWSFGGAPVTGGTGTWAGWSLVVVLEDPALPASRVAVFDGLRVIGVGESTEVELPAVAGGTGIVGSVVWDGDAGSTGDRVLVDGVPLVRAVSGADDDVFASWADGAVPFCAPVDAVECAAEANQLGFDTGVFEPTPIAGDRIRVEVTGGTEAVVLGVLSLVMRGT